MGVINFKVYIIIAIALFAILFAVQLLGLAPEQQDFSRQFRSMRQMQV